LSYPAFSQSVFPAELTRYRVPLFRPVPNGSTLVMFTVDWEKDHGEWRYDQESADYGGIVRGTAALCRLLDELCIPCTWFVECHDSNPLVDMPSACPEEFHQISSRPRDEIGLHIHWGDRARPDGTPVDLYDGQWVLSEIRANTRAVAQVAGRPIVSFRSGGHIVVPGLPGILQELDYLFDGSVEDRRTSRWRRLHSICGLTTDAYHPSPTSVVQEGSSSVLEVPTSFHLHDFGALQRKWQRLLPTRRQQVISVYIHIAELTTPRSGPNKAAEIDNGRLLGLRSLLQHWSQQPGFQWVTAQEVAHRLAQPVAAMTSTLGAGTSCSTVRTLMDDC
jgi:hypothetical protein